MCVTEIDEVEGKGGQLLSDHHLMFILSAMLVPMYIRRWEELFFSISYTYREKDKGRYNRAHSL